MLISCKYYNIPEYLVYKISTRGKDVLKSFIAYIQSDGGNIIRKSSDNIFDIGFVLKDNYGMNKAVRYLHTITPSEILNKPEIIDEILNFEYPVYRNKNKTVKKTVSPEEMRNSWEISLDKEIMSFPKDFDDFLKREQYFSRGAYRETITDIQNMRKAYISSI